MATEIPSETDILIVGAGPSGLATALSLAHRSPGVATTVVDALSEGQNGSRALVIHPRTLEALYEIGHSDPFTAAGRHAPYVTLQNRSGPLMKFEAWRLEKWTRFPYDLIIAQSTTEIILTEILREKYNVNVLRPHKVAGVEEINDGSSYHFKVQLEGQTESSVKAKYIVGADGSKSLIRNFAGIAWNQFGEGQKSGIRLSSDSTLLITLADVKLEAPLSAELIPKGVTITFGPSGFFLFIPVPLSDLTHTNVKVEAKDESRMYRVGFNIRKEEHEKARSEESKMEYMQHRIEEGLKLYNDAPGGRESESVPKVVDIVWSSTFRIRSALAESFYKSFENGGRIILVGDSAHIHSPAGGQGMNLGICDGLAAGSALSSFIGTGDDTYLSKYSEHRKAVAAEVITATRVMTWVGSFEGTVSRAARDFCFWLVGRFPIARRGAAWKVSGLGDIFD